MAEDSLAAAAGRAMGDVASVDIIRLRARITPALSVIARQRRRDQRERRALLNYLWATDGDRALIGWRLRPALDC